MSVARGDLVPSILQSCVVTALDLSSWTMSLRSEFNQRNFPSVPITSVYTHPSEGEGIHFIPEIGAYVWAAVPSEGDARPVPLAYKGLSDQSGSHRASRPGMQPGDITFQTRDRNGVKIRRGGIVEVYSTPLARMFFLPASNEIRSFAENWQLETLGGTFSWRTARAEEDPDLQKGTKLTIGAKEFASDPQFVVRLQMGGQIDQESDQVLDLRVYEDSSTTPQEIEDTPLVESLHVTGNRSSELKVRLGKDSGQFAVFVEDEGSTEGVILGKAALTALKDSLTEIQAALNGLGIPTPQTLQFITDLTTSVALPKGGAPFISTHMRTD